MLSANLFCAVLVVKMICHISGNGKWDAGGPRGIEPRLSVTVVGRRKFDATAAFGIAKLIG